MNANIASYLVDGTNKVITGNTITLNGNVVVNTNLIVTSIVANGIVGSNGNVLTSNGTSVYWSTISSNGVTSNFPTGDYGDLSVTIDAFGVSTVAGYECNAPGNIVLVDFENPPETGVPM